MAASVKVLASVLYCSTSHNCAKKLKYIIPRCYRVHKRHKSSGGHHSTEDVRSPLAGIRILDLTRILAGPYCTMILGDLGAEVIKVEKPGEGDDTRRWGPPFIGTESAYFLSVNRNKKSIGIDLKSKEGRRILIQLARKCDVLVENYVPGKLEEMRLSYNHLREMAPQLIYCSITGYGNTGPYRDRAGYDVIAAAVGGLLHITGPENGQPCKVGVAMTDLATGLYAHGAIMAALIQRQMTGMGQHIHCNLLSTQVSCLVNLGSNYLNALQEAKRWGTAHESIVPYQAFETSDGYIVLGGGNDKQFKILCERIGLPDLVDNPDYTTNEDRVKNRLSLLSIIQQLISTKSTSEWLRMFDGCGIPYGPINNMEQVFTDPQVLHNNMIVEMNHSTAGKIKLAGSPVTFSASRNSPVLPPPLLGEHTDEIMGEVLGYEPREVHRYREGKVVS